MKTPSTSTERVRKHRVAIKGNEEKYKEYLEKEKQRSCNRRKIEKKHLSKKSSKVKKEIKLKRLKQNERQRKCREKKKLQGNILNVVAEEKVSSNLVETPYGSYKSYAAFRKAVIKVKRTLPLSPRKELAVSRQLQSELQFTVNLQSSNAQSLGSTQTIKNPNLQLVSSFYERDDVSRQAPGKKDFLSVVENGKRHHKQLRHMFMTINEAFELFKDEFPDVKIGRSKFFDIRPRHVLPCSKMPHNVCVCKHCSNMEFLIKAVPNLLLDIKELLKECVCNEHNEECMLGKCDKCKNKCHTVLMKLLSKEELRDEVKWNQWKDVEGRPKVISETSILEDLLETISEQFSAYKTHVFIKRIQQQGFQHARNNILPDEAILQVDFSENFTTVTQDEIQSAHWYKEQITIFTAVAWMNDSICRSYIVVSDDLEHGKFAVWTFLGVIMKEIKKKYSIKKVHIFSDGSAAQFKNRYNFFNLTHFEEDYGVKGMWSFFATSHGKGAVDGVGGSAKRSVSQAVLSRKFLVNTASDFVLCAQKTLNKITTILVPKADVYKSMTMLSDRWEGVIPVPQTLQMHHVLPLQTGIIKVGMTLSSNFTTVVLKSQYSAKHYQSASTSQICIATKTVILGIEDYLRKHVIIEYKNGNHLRYFVGHVMDTISVNSELIVQFLRKRVGKNIYFIFPENDDFDTVPVSSVKGILNDPKECRGKFYFQPNTLLDKVGT